jgi:hypothetical protein
MVHFGRGPRLSDAQRNLEASAFDVRMPNRRTGVLGLASLGLLGGCQDTSQIQAQITALDSQVEQIKGELVASRRAIQGADAQSRSAVDGSVAAMGVATAAVETADRARERSRSASDALDRQELRSH